MPLAESTSEEPVHVYLVTPALTEEGCAAGGPPHCQTCLWFGTDTCPIMDEYGAAANNQRQVKYVCTFANT